jgi:diadenosine tetraphosphate (Ap4A) HIT family hydrolase
MSSVFTQIKTGKIPGAVLHEDAECFVILSNMPHNPGHLLVIPTKEVADWYDLDPETYSHLMLVTKYFGKATKEIYKCPKVSLVSVGFDVPHVHIHVFSLFEIADIDHENAKPVSMDQREIEADKFRKYISYTGGIK